MADVKISDLPAVSTVDPAVDVLPLVSDSGTTTTKATPDELVVASLLGISGTSGQILTYVDGSTAPIWGARDAGPAGTSGYSGISGYSGAVGISGYSGTNGTTTLQTVALADLEDKTSTVNTVGKVQGLILFETNTPQIVVSTGSSDISPWKTFTAGSDIVPDTPPA